MDTERQITTNDADITRHEIIPCNGCVAFSADLLCSQKSSDFNIFQVCQILKEDLYGNIQNGFLHDIPEPYKNELTRLLDGCYLCNQNCDNRFKTVKLLISYLDEIKVFFS